MNKKIPPKPKPIRLSAIHIDVQVDDYLKVFFQVVESYGINRSDFGYEPISGNFSGLILRLDSYLHNGDVIIDFYERLKIRNDGTIDISDYRYAAKRVYDKEEFFRADFQPRTIPKRFAPYHINASKERYDNDHFVYPEDTDIRLDLLNAVSGIQIIRYFEKSYVNPVDRANSRVTKYVQLSESGTTNVNL